MSRENSSRASTRTTGSSASGGAEVPQVYVELKEARGLNSVDLIGSADPYCVVSVGDSSLRSKVVANSVDPIWSQEFVFLVDMEEWDDEDEDDYPRVEVYLYDRDYLAPDEFLGKVEISLESLKHEAVVDKWWPLVGRPNRRRADKVKGEVSLRLHYTHSPVPSGLPPGMADALRPKYAALHSILPAASYSVPQALLELVPTDEAESTVNALTGLLATQSSGSIDLIHLLLTKEIKATPASEASGSLLRGYSLASKMIGRWLRLHALGWLHSVLEKPIATLAGDKSMSYNVDDEDTKTSAKAIAAVERAADMIVTAILGSVSTAPTGLRSIMAHLSKEMEARLPDHRYAALGSVVLLRWFSIAVVAPHSYGVIHRDPPQSVSTGLTEVSKLIQAAATGRSFSKGSSLADLNPWVDKHIPLIKKFLDDLAGPGAGGPPAPPASPEEVNIMDYVFIHKSLRRYQAKLATTLQKDKAVEGGASMKDREEVLGSLGSFLKSAGDPPKGIKSKCHKVSNIEIESERALKLDASGFPQPKPPGVKQRLSEAGVKVKSSLKKLTAVPPPGNQFDRYDTYGEPYQQQAPPED